MTSDEGNLWQVWIDTGGTFTDCIAISREGVVRRAKVLSSSTLRFSIEHVVSGNGVRIRPPWPPIPGLLNGWGVSIPSRDWLSSVIKFDSESGVVAFADAHPPDVLAGETIQFQSAEEAPVLAARLVTGTPAGDAFPRMRMRLATTRGTNALLERSGHPPVLFITKGFGDLLEIGNQARPDLFAKDIIKPRPLYVAAVEVAERLSADGTILRALDEDHLRESARRMIANGHRVAAISFMHSYLNPIHEHRAENILLEEGFTTVRSSASLAPLIRLLPRAQTAVVDAYLSPIIDHTICRVRDGIGEESLASLHLMTSAGGLVRDSSFRAKDSLLSGPAGGVVGIAAMARSAGLTRVIGFDMGGTSTDVARWDGEYAYVFEHRIADALLVAPAMAIESVAAGGGSICSFTDGRMQVGPESARADPGPACYGAGGPLTITDVNLLLGRLVPASFGIPIDVTASRERLAELRESLSTQTGETPSDEDLLAGFLAIANERMAGAIHQISAAEGYDPADFTLIAFGGAGGQHACAIAELLGMKRVFVPADASLLSALGLGAASFERFFERQVMETIRAGETVPMSDLAGELEREAREQLMQEFVDAPLCLSARRLCSMRYIGQDATLSIDWDRESDLVTLFERKYESIFAYRPEGKSIELESIRVVVSAPSPDLPQLHGPVAWSAGNSSLQDCHVGGKWRQVAVHEQDVLSARVVGPALICGRSTVTLVDEGWVGEANSSGGLMLTRCDPAGRPF